MLIHYERQRGRDRRDKLIEAAFCTLYLPPRARQQIG